MRFGGTRQVSPSSAKFDRGCFVVIIVILLVGSFGYLTVQQYEWQERKLAYSEVEDEIIEPMSDRPSEFNNQKVVKISSANVTADSILQDNDFRLMTSNRTLRLKRVSEYCQWEEYVHTHNDSGRIYKTYTYVKGWHSHRINSLFFNNPLNHNPQRDPFPSHQWDTSGARIGGYHVGELFISKLQSFAKLDGLDQYDLNNFYSSPASTAHNFKFVGNGYFYSAHQTGMIEKILNVINFQIGDLFSSCEAGDIRVHYSYVMPHQEISVIGEQVNQRGDIKEHLTTRGYQIALMREGFYTAHEFLMADLKDFKFSLNIMRICFGVLLLIGLAVFFRSVKGDQVRLRWIIFTSILMTLTILNVIWIFLYFFTKSVIIWTFALSTIMFASYDQSFSVFFKTVNEFMNRVPSDEERAKNEKVKE